MIASPVVQSADHSEPAAASDSTATNADADSAAPREPSTEPSTDHAAATGSEIPPLAGVGAHAHARLLDLMTIAALVMVVVPLVVALVAVGGDRWFPTGDLAQAELHMRGFFAHPPLVGAAGRIGDIATQGSHPGPAMWVAMLPVYLLFGRSSLALMVAVTVVQLAFILLTVWLVRRLIGPFGGLAVAIATMVLVRSLGTAPFIEPWNPWLALFAFSACIAASWGVMCGRKRWLWLAAFCGVFAVQCHAGYVPLVGALLAVLAVVTLWRWYHQRGAGEARWWWVAVGTVVAMWVPPLLDQWRRSPGNLRILFTHFTSSTDPGGGARSYVGLSGALKAFAGEFSIAGPWVRGPFRQPGEAPSWAMFVLTLALFVALGWAIHRRRPSRDVTVLGALLGGVIVVGIIATSRIFGEFYDYVIRWWWVVVAWAFVAATVALVERVGRAREIGFGLLGAAAVACVLASVHAADTDTPGARDSASVGGITAAIEPMLDPDAHYLVRWHDPASLGGVPYGVVLELERDGFRPGVDAWGSAAALPHRVIEIEQADEVLWVVVGERAISDFRARADATELGYFDQRSPAEREASDQLRADLERRLVELGMPCMIARLDTQYGLAPFVIGNVPVPEDVKRLAGAYDTLRLPVAVFTVPVDSPGYEIITGDCP